MWRLSLNFRNRVDFRVACDIILVIQEVNAMFTKQEFLTKYQLAFVKQELISFFYNLIFDKKQAVLFALACCRESRRYAKHGEQIIQVMEDSIFQSTPFSEMENNLYKIDGRTNTADPLGQVRMMFLGGGMLTSLAQVCRTLAEHGFSTNTAQNNEKIAEILYWMNFQTEIISKHCTSDVRGLAKTIYTNKEFCLMPILADALQEAGYNQEEGLTRLRDRNARFHRGESMLDRILSYCE